MAIAVIDKLDCSNCAVNYQSSLDWLCNHVGVRQSSILLHEDAVAEARKDCLGLDCHGIYVNWLCMAQKNGEICIFFIALLGAATMRENKLAQNIAQNNFNGFLKSPWNERALPRRKLYSFL